MERTIELLSGEPALAGYHPSFLALVVEHRMRRVGTLEPAEYAALMAAGCSERDALIEMLPVPYTGFFRDPDVWAHLASDVVPSLVAERARAGAAPIVVWNPGCAAGHETHGLACLFAEALGADGLDRLALLGTDIDHRSISAARQGRYWAHEAAGLPPGLRDRYFQAEGVRFTIDPRLRACMAFAEHDLLRHRPFSKLDMIVCRNTLIYFSPPTQRRLLTAFHFGLRPGGYLVVGGYERQPEGYSECGWERCGPCVYRKVEQHGTHPWVRSGCSVLESLDHRAAPTPAERAGQGAGPTLVKRAAGTRSAALDRPGPACLPR